VTNAIRQHCIAQGKNHASSAPGAGAGRMAGASPAKVSEIEEFVSIVKLFWGMLYRLPFAQREVLLLVCVEELSYLEAVGTR